MAAAPAAKRIRTSELEFQEIRRLRGRLPFITQSALAAVLKIAATEELPKVTNRHHIRKARDFLAKEETPFGALHQTISVGGGVQLEIQHPAAMLYYAVKSSPAFGALIERKLGTHPCSLATPWRLCLYTDEISPGNQLAHVHRRKAWGVYWSIAEFDEQLSAEDIIVCA